MAFTFRIYTMPIIGVGTKLDPRRPKYKDTHLAGLSWGMMDYGNEPLALVGVRDIPELTHAALAAEIDVLALPENLDTQVGAQALTITNSLENRNIPGNWVQSTDSYRSVIRVVAQACQFMQRLQGTTVTRLFDTDVTLGTRFNQLPVAVRNSLVEAATSLGYDTSSLSGTSTLRTILKTMADQWTQIEMFLAGHTI